MSGSDREQAVERWGKALADVVPLPGRREVVCVDVERDRRACMTELASSTDGIEALADEVAREGVPQVVHREVRPAVSVEPRSICRFPEAADADVVRHSFGRLEDEVVLGCAAELERGLSMLA
jgi:hypothetical protein